MTSKQIRTVFLFIIILILFILVFLIFKPFLNIFLWAILISIIVNPFYKKIVNKIKKISENSFIKSIVAAILSFFTILIIVIPLIFLVYRLAIELKQFTYWLENLLQNNLTENFERINNLIEKIIYSISGVSLKFDLLSEITKLLKANSVQLATIITSLASKLINLLLGIFFLIITLYFILTDSDILVKYLEDIIPIEKRYIDNFILKFRLVMEVIIKGYFIIGFYQAIMMFLILLIFKYSNPFLFASLTFIASFIPMLGPTVIWLPISIFLGISQSILKGVLFAIISGFLVSTVDNFIRPILISNKIKIHPLLLFFSIIGGLIAFGYNGVILGPLFLALLYSSLEIIKTQQENI